MEETHAQAEPLLLWGTALRVAYWAFCEYETRVVPDIYCRCSPQPTAEDRERHGPHEPPSSLAVIATFRLLLAGHVGFFTMALVRLHSTYAPLVSFCRLFCARFWSYIINSTSALRCL